MGDGLAVRPPCLPHSQVLMGAGLAGGPLCLPYGQVLMGAGLVTRAEHFSGKSYSVCSGARVRRC